MILTANHLYNVLEYSRSEIENIILNKEKYYYQYSTRKLDTNNMPKIKNGIIERRYYQPSKNQLRDIQNKIQDRILSKIQLPKNVRGGIRGCGSIENAKIHKGKKYRFQTDLTNFFPSVSSDMVYSSLRKKGFSKQVARIICELTTVHSERGWRSTCLPQGAPTSPMLANIIFEKTDWQLVELINNKEIFYTRWIDDLTFSSKSEISSDFQNQIVEIISRNGFKISRKKTTYKMNISTITGVDVGMSTMKVTDKFRNVDESGMKPLQVKGRREYKNQVYIIDKGVKK